MNRELFDLTDYDYDLLVRAAKVLNVGIKETYYNWTHMKTIEELVKVIENERISNS